MLTEINTVFDKVVTEVPRDEVTMVVPVQIAHLILNLLGCCTLGIDRDHGADPQVVSKFFHSLHRTLGHPPQSAYPRLKIERRL